MNIQGTYLHYSQIWLAFQQIQYQQQIYQLWYHQLYQLYLQYCQSNFLNPFVQSSFNLFYQFYFKVMLPQPPTPSPPPAVPTTPYISPLTELLPRQSKQLYVEPKENEKSFPNLMNIILKTSFEYQVMLSLPGNTTIKEMFERYMQKLNLPIEHLEKDLVFLFDGRKVDPFSNEPISSKFRNNIFIIVLDQGGIIGG